MSAHYHEAGHAIVALALGRSVDYVSCEPERDWSGITLFDWPCSRHVGAIVLAAGEAADRLARIPGARVGAGGDRRIFRRLGLALGRWRHYVALATAILRAEWRAWRALARSLRVAGRLDTGEILAAIRGAQ